MSKRIRSDRESEKALLRCVDKSLDIFGESGKRAVYWHLESEHGVIADNIWEEPVRLTDALRKIFGPGVKAIEARIIKEISTCICPSPSSITTFADAVNFMKTQSTGRKVRKVRKAQPIKLTN